MATRPEITGRRNLEFSGWCRENLQDAQHGLTIHDLDFVFSNFNSGLFISSEIKTRCRIGLHPNALRFTQKAFIKMLDEMLTIASRENQNTREIVDLGSRVVYRYLGFYVIGFSNTTPDNSPHIYINGEEITRNRLIECLNLESDVILQYRRQIN